MDSKIIEALKKNEKPFGLMTDEMQDFARELKGENWLKYRYGVTSTDWELIEVFPSGDFEESRTYRLRPDYKEEPEASLVIVDVLKRNTKPFNELTQIEMAFLLTQDKRHLEMRFACGKWETMFHDITDYIGYDCGVYRICEDFPEESK